MSADTAALRRRPIPASQVDDDDENATEADEPEYCQRCYRYVSLEKMEGCDGGSLPRDCLNAIARFEY